MKIINIIFLIAMTLNAYADEMQAVVKDSYIGFEIIKFKIKAPVEGHFDNFVVKANYDKNEKVLSSIKALIEIKSVNTDQKDRDAHLQSKDFFNAGVYPQMLFESNEIIRLDGPFKMPGKLTIRDVTRYVEIDFYQVRNNEDSIYLEGGLKLNRLDYNVSWNAALEKNEWVSVFGKLGKFVLDDEVKIKLRVLLKK